MKAVHSRCAGALVALAVGLAAHAQPQSDPPDAAAATPPASAASAPARPAADPTAPKPFAEVVRGARRTDGLFPVWRKDEKVWLEIPQAMVGKPFLFSVNIANSVGERGMYASQMGPVHLAEVRVVGRQLQLVAINTKFRAVSDTGSERAIGQAFSPSLLASGAVASAEHPASKAVLVDAAMLFTDIPGYSTRLESAYRLPFSLDRANSSFQKARADDRLTALTARIHFATPRIPAPALAPSPVAQPTPPQATPDPRSLFVDYVYSFLALPEQPMVPRHADPRLGHFAQSFTDLGGDMKANPRVHYVKRWRLEKRDPSAPMSEPVKPIVFWLDKNIPVKYRPAVEAGILEWNRAFAKIGFKDAIVVKQQPDDADWDNMDAGHASVRWFVGADVGFAIGPSHADPRTGEILDADIGMSDVFARGSRRAIVEDIGRRAHQHHTHASDAEAYSCEDAAMAAMEAQFALDLLEARDEIAPGSPEAEEFVMDTIRGTMMHEVGHVLGLKHNFRGSTTITPAQLQDMAFTKVNSISNSVMDYTPVNLAAKGEKQGAYLRTTLGAYDYWAIEYAYKPVDPAREAAELASIAARSTEPLLAYADDVEAGGAFGNDGADPLTNRFDLGSKPLDYYKKRFLLSRELWARIQERRPQPGEDPLRHRRSILAGFAPLPAMAELAAKHVGGMHSERDLPGSQRPAFRVADPALQREALQFLAREVFSVGSFEFKPEFLATLTVDYNEWDRGGPADIPAAVERVQAAALDRLMSAGTAKRMLDLPLFVPQTQHKNLISLAEVYGTLQKSIWSELAGAQEIARMRRTLQREHIKRVQALLLRPPASMPADAISLLRYHAGDLQSQLKAALARSSGSRSVETRAHLAESLGTLTEALRATMQRS